MERTQLRARPATATVILLCTLAFGVLAGWASARADEPAKTALVSLWQIRDVELMTRLGALADVRVWLDGEWWRVVTAGLLHGSWLHLGLNMMGLWSVGQWTEKAWGGWRSTGVFALSSIVGCLASLAWAEAPLVVGASAGIFGLAGALVVARAWGSEPVRRTLEPISARTLGGWLIFWLAFGFALPLLFGVELIAQAGHIGGLLAGGALGWALSRERRGFETLGWAAVVAGGLGLVGLGREPTWRVNYHVFVGHELLQREDFSGAAASFDEALRREPDDPELANAVAWALVEAGVELERAEVLVRDALETEPERADFLDTLGWVLCKQGRTEEGVEALGRALEVDPGIEEIETHLELCSTWNSGSVER
ncbi:rhomboid family intramembrane serine protease [Nannocystaceae bacterium ST9]